MPALPRGTKQMLRSAGENHPWRRRKLADLDKLEDLCNVVREASLCGLGQTAPNPVLTTLKYFRHEYEQHIREHTLRAGLCGNLQLSPCENTCPLNMNSPASSSC